MRRLFSTFVVIIVVGLAGCKNQGTSTFTNPFLTPDRVPPPSTRVLAPGTAQPYYPGDPAPGAAPAVGPPPAGTPTYGPGATLPPATLPPSTQPLTTPAGGWGATVQPQSSVTPTAGSGVPIAGIPGDNPQLSLTGTQSLVPQRMTAREVTPAEYLAPSTSAAGAKLTAAESTGDSSRASATGDAPPINDCRMRPI